MTHTRTTIRQTSCSECGSEVLVYREGDFDLVDVHFRRNPFTHNIEQCSQSRALVTTRIREYDSIVTGV